MRRANNTTDLRVAIDVNGAGKNGFQGGNPATGLRATQVSADWLNTVQEELMNIPESVGMTESLSDKTQVAQALRKMLQNQAYTSFTTAGIASAYTGSITPAPAALVAGLRVRVKFHASTTAASTLNLNALGVKPIKQMDSTGLLIDVPLFINQLADLEYDGTNWIVLDPVGIPTTGGTATGMISAPKFRANKGVPSTDTDNAVGFAFNGPDGDTGMFAEGGTANSNSSLIFRIDGVERLKLQNDGSIFGNGNGIYNAHDLYAANLGATADLSTANRVDLSLTFTSRGTRLSVFCQARIDSSTSGAGANDATLAVRIIRVSDGAQVGSGWTVVQSLQSGQGVGLYSAGNLSLSYFDGGLVKGTQYRIEVVSRKTQAVGLLYLKDVLLNAINT